MAQVKNVAELYKLVTEKYLVQAMANEVTNEARKAQQKTIQSEVYDRYPHPIQYDRRGNKKGYGGLASDEVFEFEDYRVSGSYDTVSMALRNKAKSAGEGQSFYLSPLIEGGDGAQGLRYDFPLHNRDETIYTYLQPRPFTQPAVEEMIRTGQLRDALKKGLRRQGLNVR